MVEGDEHALLGELVVVLPSRLDEAHGTDPLRAAVVVHRLRHSEEIKADADTAREKHGEPRRVRELGLLVLLAKLDVAVLRVANVEHVENPYILGSNVEPRHVLRDPGLPLGKLRKRLVGLRLVLGARQHGNHERPQDDRGQRGNNPVQAEEAEGADVHGHPAVGADVLEKLLLISEVDRWRVVLLDRVDRNDREPVWPMLYGN
mmetsp:Transcript_33338/g.78598  ORF Transcript_33338/g.78598 Transcript_33338/m.78598 type:complete len:204 (+) Transcript_33338:2187-2798(+)